MNLTEADLLTGLKIESKTQRKLICRQIKKLLELYKKFNKKDLGKNSEAMLMSDLNQTLGRITIN
jgi:hypothetical protein